MVGSNLQAHTALWVMGTTPGRWIAVMLQVVMVLIACLTVALRLNDTADLPRSNV
jgi:hypothetical protein